MTTPASRAFGSGWLSGVLSVTLGAIGLGAVFCFHYPSLLTMPELRGLYPIPFIRADWLTAALGKDSPLAADLRSLTALHTALEGGEGARLPCGPTPRAFGRLNPVQNNLPRFLKLGLNMQW